MHEVTLVQEQNASEDVGQCGINLQSHRLTGLVAAAKEWEAGNRLDTCHPDHTVDLE
jgi:hypothetical protein